MKISLKPGKYVVAVSGGMDSMVLLDVLVAHMAGHKGFELTVAHFEHGIRTDSDFDRQVVERAAKNHGLPFVWERGRLGRHTSEARAREARYAFLRRVKQEQGADAIITAHHQDDVIETAILNMLRGTHRRGLSSLASTPDVLRPFLHLTKPAILEYAGQHPGIIWRADSTNDSDQYLRNYLRRHILRGMGGATRQLLLDHIQKAAATNPIIDSLLLHDINLHSSDAGLDRRWFTLLPYDVSCEVMAAWLRFRDVREFDRRAIARLVVAAKVDKSGKIRDINAAYWLDIGKTRLQLVPKK